MATQTPVLSKMVSFRQPDYIQELMKKRVRPNEKTKFYNEATLEKLARTPLLPEVIEEKAICKHLKTNSILSSNNYVVQACETCGAIL